MGKATGKEKTGERALEIAEQINLAKEMLIGFSRPGEVCDALADRWGVSERTARARLAQARKLITSEVNDADRQDDGCDHDAAVPEDRQGSQRDASAEQRDRRNEALWRASRRRWQSPGLSWPRLSSADQQQSNHRLSRAARLCSLRNPGPRVGVGARRVATEIIN